MPVARSIASDQCQPGTRPTLGPSGTFFDALGVKFLARMSERMHHPIYVRGIVVVVGAVLAMAGLAGIIFGA